MTKLEKKTQAKSQEAEKKSYPSPANDPEMVAIMKSLIKKIQSLSIDE